MHVLNESELAFLVAKYHLSSFKSSLPDIMAEIPKFMLNQPDGIPVDLPELPQRDLTQCVIYPPEPELDKPTHAPLSEPSGWLPSFNFYVCFLNILNNSQYTKLFLLLFT